jgi:peptidoglycan/LPS O-acetylase OafA/YrhL
VAILAVFAQHLGDRFMPFVEREITESAWLSGAREGAGLVPAAVPTGASAWILAVLHHAHWGVDLFFVLSGFSLAQGYLRAFARRVPPSPARAFLLRRAARILPAYWVALAIVLAFHHAVLRSPDVGAAIAAHLLVLQGYVTPGGIVIIGATWSLSTEIGFYLVLPLLARPLLAPGRRRWVVGAALCLAAWATRAVLHAATLDPGVRTALLEATQRRWIVSRIDQFVLGAMAAAVVQDLPVAWARRLAPAALALAVPALVVGFRLEGERYLSPGGSWPYAIVSLATAGLVLGAALSGTWIAPLPLRAVGVVSYGVFLYHQLAIGLVGALIKGSGWGVLAANAALGLALSLAAGAASWVLVERPALRTVAARPS